VNRALWWLLRADTRGAARAIGRRARDPLTVVLVLGFLALAVFFAFATRGTSGISPAGARQIGAPILMLVVLRGVFSPHGLFFRPAEIDWLFPAPVSRRSLTLFNIAVRARTAVLSGLILPMFVSWRGTSVVFTFLGYTFVFLLLQISAQWFAVVRAWLVLRVGVGVRASLGIALFAVPLGAVALELRQYPGGFETFFIDSVALSMLGTLTGPFLSIITADSAVVAARYAAVSLAILAAIVGHIVWLDVPYRETAVVGTERFARRLARMRGGGGSFAVSTARARLRLPMFPRLRGVGPICWRQTLELLRNPHGIALVVVVVAVTTGGSLAGPLLRGAEGDPFPLGFALVGVFLATWVPLLMGENIACDFRRDFDRMPVLKSWPVSPLAVATGQIAAAVGFASCIQLAALAIIAVVSRALPSWLLIAAPLLLPAISWIAISLDNLLFLWIPYRNVPEDPGDVGFVGRTFALTGLKFLTITLLLTGALFVGYLAQVATQSRVVSVGVLVMLLSLACIVATHLVARAYRRFDVSRDAPV
jgi:hypothetical protein